MRGLVLLCVFVLPAFAGDVERLIGELSAPEMGRRKQAAEELGRLKARQAVPALIENLIDDSPAVRAAAIQALGQIGDPVAAQALAMLLPSAVHGADAAEALVALGPGAMPALIERVKDPATRKVVLTRIAGTNALKWLAGAQSWHVRKWAVDIAGRLDKIDAEWKNILAQAATKDPAGAVRMEATEALGLHGEADLLIAPLLHDKEGIVRRMAARGLSRIAKLEKKHIDALIIALEDKETRLYAARALGRAKQHKELVVAALKKEGSDPAYLAIAQFGHWDREVMLRLVEIAKKARVPSPHGRRNLRVGGTSFRPWPELKKVLPGPPEFGRMLEKALARAKDREIKIKLIWVLGHMKRVPVTALYEKDKEVRWEAAMSQPRLAALPILLKRAGDDEVDDAVRSIGMVALPVLLREFDRRVRFSKTLVDKGAAEAESVEIPYGLARLISSFGAERVQAAALKVDGLSGFTREYFSKDR